MAIGKSYLKLHPTADYPDQDLIRWNPDPGIAAALISPGAEYGLSSEYGGETARAHYLLRPDFTIGGILYKFTIHFQYEMTRTGGTHLFELNGLVYSVHYSTYTDKIKIYGDDSASGTMNYEKVISNWDYLFPRFSEASRYIGPKCFQGTSAFDCYAKVWDYYILIEFTPVSDIVTTQAVTDITVDSGKGNGEIIALVDGLYERRGFEYYEDGDEENKHTVYEEGNFDIGTFNLDITGLNSNTKYYVRAFALKDDLTVNGDWVDFTTPSEKDASGKAYITTSVIAEMSYIAIETVRAYRSSAFTRMELTGNIKKADNIFKRGFEYIVQDGEPDEEAEGTEIIEESEEEFETGEYTLNDYDEELPLMYRNPLYQLEKDTIFWFRAIAYIGEEKETSDWMKNVPTMTTSECTETTAFSTKGHGELTNIGANIVTKRGFYLIKEFSGSIFNIKKYTWHGFIVLNLTPTTLYNPNGTLMGFAYEGELAKIVYTKDIYGYDPGEYELGIGTGILDSIYPNDTYKVKAFGENQLGRGFGEEVSVTTDPVISEPNTEYENPGGEDLEPIESPTTAIKTVRVDNLTEGYKIIRIGIKYGRTPSCNEGIVYEDGEWNNGEGITLFITDLIPGEKYYETPFVVVEDDSGAQDEIEEIPGDNWDDEFPPLILPEWEDYPDIETPLPDLVGIDYETIIKEIKCSIIADQSIIDKYGRRRTLTIKNNLIQTKESCISIRDNYLNRFQEVKLKIDIDYDIPLPFEREDTILLAYGQINYKTDGNGVIEAKANGEGIISGKMSILTKIRKISINAKAGEAILALELEV